MIVFFLISNISKKGYAIPVTEQHILNILIGCN